MKKIFIIAGVIIIFSGVAYTYLAFSNARTLYHGSVVVLSGDINAANETQKLKIGFGPMGFIINNDRLLADKDITGFPNKEKYKEAVRKDIASINYPTHIEIDENSWEIETKYPWTAVY